MTSHRRPIVLAVCLVLALGALALSYFLAFHLDSLQRMTREQFARLYGPSVQIGQIHASLFPPQLELIDVFLKEDGAPDPFFHASRLRLDLTVFSFLQDYMEYQGLLIEQPSLHLLRDKTGQWNIPKAWTSRGTEGYVFGAWLSPFKLHVLDGQIVIIDVFERETPESLMVKGIQLHMMNSSSQSPVDFSLSAHLAHKQSESPFALYGNVDDFSNIFDWLRGTASSSIPSMAMHGRVSLAKSEIAQLAKLFNRETLPLAIYGDMELQGKVHLGPGEKGYQLVLSEIALQTDALTMMGDANFAGLFESEPPTISIHWSGSPIDIAAIVDLVPTNGLPPDVVDAISRNLIGGKIEVLSATLSGSLREKVGLSMVADVHLTEGSLDLGTKWGIAKSLEGTVKIEPDQIRLFDFHGVYDSIPVTSGIGLIEFRESGPWLTTELQGDVPVVKLLNILQHVFDWQAPHTMSSLRGLEGSGPMRVHFAGPLQHSGGIAFQDASYFPQAVSLYVPGFTRPLTGVSGNLTFSTTQIKFEQVRALWRHSELSVHGSIHLQDGKYYDDIQVQGRLQGEDVLEWGSGRDGNESFVRGPSLFEGMLSGPLKKPRVALSLDIEPVKIFVPGILKKSSGVGGSLKVELMVDEGDTVVIDRVGLSLPSFQASGRGVFPVTSRGSFSASVIVEPLTVSKLPSGVSILGDALKSGILEVSLNVDGKLEDWRQWNKNGWVALTDGRFDVKGIQAPLTDILLRLKLQDHEAEVKRFEFRLVKSQARIEGVVHDWETSPTAEISVFGQQFDLDQLIPKGRRSPVRELLEHVASTTQVSGQVTFEQAYYKDLQFPQLSGNFRIHDEVIGLEQIVGKMDQGELKGRFLVHLPVRKAASVKSWINLMDASLETLERSFFQQDTLKERMLTGMVSLDGMIEGDGKNKNGTMSSLQGRLKCLIKDGRIQRGTIVPKMLALMNLPTLLQGKVDLNKDGYPFDTQSATIEVSEGIFKSKDIVMSGPILKMTAAGDYDAVHDELNIVAAASPFGPYFDLLKKVPLFRMLLEGEEKGVGMALFEVKGSLHNPQVQALPLESFASGLTGFAKLAFTVLKNTIMLPTKILFPETETTPSSSGQVDRNKDAGVSRSEVIE